MQSKGGYDRRGFIGRLATAVLAAGFRPALAQDNRLVVPTYGGRYERFWREVLIPPFERKTGVQTVLDIGLGANFATKLRASGPDNPPYSYLMANEFVGAVLRTEGFFEPWPAEKVPKTYQALLDPAWKGKIAWRIGSSSGTPLFLTNLRLAWGEERARIYFEKLKEQKIVNFGSGSARTLVDRVVAGEYAIALNIFAHHPLISKAKGAPVNSQLMDPVASTAATMGIVKGAKHPNAALLLIDFILSKEGQEVLAAADYFPADPQVPPAAGLASVVPRIAGLPENFVGPEKLTKYTDSSQEIFRQLFR